jgi:hypothetical protein
VRELQNETGLAVVTSGINTNTYMSIGLFFALAGGFWAVINTIYTTKAEITSKQERFEMKIEALDARMGKFEKLKETWSFQDQFKWSVHLQRDNPNIKIPEPTDTEKP